MLYEAWLESGRRDGSGLSEKEIGEGIGSSADRFRLQKAFADSETVGSIPRSPSKGQWALCLGTGNDRHATAA